HDVAAARDLNGIVYYMRAHPASRTLPVQTLGTRRAGGAGRAGWTLSSLRSRQSHGSLSSGRASCARLSLRSLYSLCSLQALRSDYRKSVVLGGGALFRVWPVSSN